jgi:dTMP kinase
LTILLDLPVEAAMMRIIGAPDRLEKRGGTFYARVRNGFLSQLPRASAKSVVIDAQQPLQEVHQQIASFVAESLGSIQI